MGKQELVAEVTRGYSRLLQLIDEHCEAPPPPKTINLVLVGFEGFALENFYSAIKEVPHYIDPWLADQGLKVKRWALHKVNLPGEAKDYDYWKMTWALINNGTITMDGENAWYILVAQKLPWPIGGTVGGDRFKQEKGQVPGYKGYMRVPGISYADFGCVYGLRYNKPPPNSVYPKDRNNVLGWMAHEAAPGHNCALLPCRCGHATNCIMAQGCYRFPDGAVLGCDNPWILGPASGDEVAEAVKYGFMERNK